MMSILFRGLFAPAICLCLLSASPGVFAVNGITLKSKCKYIGVDSFNHTHRQEDLGITPDYDAGLCAGYIQGAVDTLKNPCGMKLDQEVLVQEVWLFLEDYPEKLTQHAGNLIIEALDKSTVCKQQASSSRNRSKRKKPVE